MRGGMPSPPYVQAASVLVFPAPSRRSPSVWLSPLVVGLTVALAGAATGYSASQLRQTGVVNLGKRPALVRSVGASGAPVAATNASPSRQAVPVRRVRPAVDPLARVLDDPVVGRLTIGIQKPLPLTVVADGKVHQLKTMSRTPAQVLTDLGIALGPADRVVPAANTPLWSGVKVRVVRIQQTVAAKHVPLPVPVVYKPDPTLPRGRVVTVPGHPGAKVQRFLQTLADGKVVSMTFLGQEVIRPSTPRVVRTGTKVLVASRGAFAGREYMDMVATAYAPWCCRGVDNITSIGLHAGYGVVAVDPRIIPLRSKVYIEGYGYAVAGDVGSAIKGLRIDLGMDTTRLAKQFGRRPVRVYIIEKAPPKKPKK